MLLEVDRLDVRYGTNHAVRGISLRVDAGEIVTVLGANGAGKSSLLKAIMGAVPAAGGRINFDGQDITGKGSSARVRSGLILVPEGRQIFVSLTVEENLQLAQIAPPKGWSLDRIYELFPRLGERRKQEGVTLSGGEQQMLSIARALARDIKVLLLDEPYEGLAPVIVQEIAKTLAYIRDQGITTVIVEQNAVAALKLADRAVILDIGKVVYDGSAKEVLENKELREQYLAI